MNIDCEYPGGNIIVKNTDNSTNTVTLEQDIRDTMGWWFYWNFRVKDADGKTYKFKFTNGEVVSDYVCAVSSDGISWSWCDRNCFISNTEFKYTFRDCDKILYFAFSMPYQVENFNRFIIDKPVVKTTLTYSEAGQALPLLTIGNGRHDILFTCRHHCCEAMASYVLEGIINSLIGSPLCDKFTFHIVPFVDIDGVENGDQGKDRYPHDHNRDYIPEPLYNYTKAIYSYCQDKNLTAFIDLHCPWKWGERDSLTHIHLSEVLDGRYDAQEHFINALRETTEQSNHTIKYNNNLYISRYGGSANKVGTPNSKNYFNNLKGMKMAFSLETPYFGNGKEAYSINDLHNWGEDIVKTIYKEQDLL